MKSYKEFLQELSIRMERNVFEVEVLYTVTQRGKKQSMPITMDIPAPDEKAAMKEAEKHMATAVKNLEHTGPGVKASAKITNVKQRGK